MPHSGTKQKNLSDWIEPIFRAPGAIPELFYLTEFFLKKQGIPWTGVPETGWIIKGISVLISLHFYGVCDILFL